MKTASIVVGLIFISLVLTELQDTHIVIKLVAFAAGVCFVAYGVIPAKRD